MFGRAEPLSRGKVWGRAAQIGALSSRRAWALGRGATRHRALPALACDLGPPFVKIGQLVAASPGSFAPSLVQALRGLHDDVRPQPFHVIEPVLQDAYGHDWRTLIKLSESPIAAGSVAQVHRGTLADGTPVAVKLQRADITENLEADVRLLRVLAAILVRARPSLAPLKLVETVDDFAVGFEQELDFAAEVTSMERLRPVLARWDIDVPRIHAELCRPQVIVMDFVDVVPVRDRDQILALGAEPEALLRSVLGALLESAFVEGRFHADGHGGNVLVGTDGNLVMLDFGIVGDVLPDDRAACAGMLAGVFQQDFNRFAEGLLRMQAFGHTDDAAAGAVAAVVAEHLGSGDFAQVKMGLLLRDMLDMASKYELPFPTSLILLLKQLLYFDGLATVLAPNFDLFHDARQFVPMLEQVGAENARSTEGVAE